MVPGLSILENVISLEVERELVEHIEKNPPERCAGRTRLDVYGLGAFARTSVGRKEPAIPLWLYQLGMAVLPIDAQLWDSVSVSEYAPGEGVAEHTDRDEAGPVISTLALLSDAWLAFRKSPISPRHLVEFPRRSLMVLTDPARSAPWTHELLAVPARRFSIAFRGLPTTIPLPSVRAGG